jgi:hypothetical protein
VDHLKTLEEIEALVEAAALSADDEGELEPLDAVRELRVTTGRSCGHNGFGQFLGIHNTNRTKRIRAYYRITSNINGPWTGNRWIGPRQTEWFTCSYPAPNQYMSLAITAATYEDPC